MTTKEENVEKVMSGHYEDNDKLPFGEDTCECRTGVLTHTLGGVEIWRCEWECLRYYINVKLDEQTTHMLFLDQIQELFDFSQDRQKLVLHLCENWPDGENLNLVNVLSEFPRGES